MKKLLILVSLLLTTNVYAQTARYRYINTDCTSFNGDGTSNTCASSSGGAGAYNSQVNFANNEAKNLVSANVNLYVEASGSAIETLSTALGKTFESSTGTVFTTDATHQIYYSVAAGSRHNGSWATGKYGWKVYPTNGIVGLAGAKYLTLDGLQVDLDQGSGYGTGNMGTIDSTFTDHVITLKNCIIKYDGNTSNEYQALIKFQYGKWTHLTFINNLFIGQWAAGNSGIFDIRGGENAVKVIIYNNTFILKNQGLSFYQFFSDAPSDSLYIKNNIFYQTGSSATNYSSPLGFLTTVTSNNISTDNTSPNVEGRSKTITFVGSGDYHLASNDTAAIDAGADLSSDAQFSFSNDIDGQTRETPWDIGADEYGTGSSSSSSSTSSSSSSSSSSACPETSSFLQVRMNGGF